MPAFFLVTLPLAIRVIQTHYRMHYVGNRGLTFAAASPLKRFPKSNRRRGRVQ